MAKCSFCNDSGVEITACELYSNSACTFVPEYVACRHCEAGTALNVVCMWCGKSSPCTRPDCTKNTGIMASAAATLNESFETYPMPLYVRRFPDSMWGMTHKKHMDEAEAMEADR